MRFLDRLLHRLSDPSSAASPGTADAAAPPAPPSHLIVDDPAMAAGSGRQDPRFLPVGGDLDRWATAPGGRPPLHLVPDLDALGGPEDPDGEGALQLCEDATGLLVPPSHRALPHAGIYVSALRGEGHHRESCRRGDFRPGAAVRLVRERTNGEDPYAVAVHAGDRVGVAAYVNRSASRLLARPLDEGRALGAVSLRGTRPGRPCSTIAVLAAPPAVLAHLLSPRPAHLPPPARRA